MLEYALILPAGSGKSFLASKYDFLIDIDSLHNEKFRKELQQKYEDTLKTGTWEEYNKFECNWVLPHLQKYPKNYILLLHCHEKANILGLTILGSFKPRIDVINKVILERGKEKGDITLHNWNNIKDVVIMDSHQSIEKEVLKIYKTIS